MKNQWKTIGIEEKLDIISLEKKVNKLLTYVIILDVPSSVHTIHDNADRIRGSARFSDNIKCQQSEAGSVCVARLPQSYQI